MTPVPRVLSIPPYQQFLESYLEPNQPVILGPDLVNLWPAFEIWTKPKSSESTQLPNSLQEDEAISSGRSINLDHLSQHYGDHEVSVADCGSPDSLGNLECTTMALKDVLDKWRRGEGQSLYVKDWHLARAEESPDGTISEPFYTTPKIFQDDWMNAYYAAHTSDDFRFVYIGAQGTFTPLHRDVYTSYSWSTNICGRKKWWLFPPEQTQYLFMKERNVCVHDVRHVDQNFFPSFAKASPLVVVQEEGETIFVPSGWYHQVENLDACISINHNWCNSVNLPSLYSSMCDKVDEVENVLEDVRSMLQGASHQTDSRVNADSCKWKREFTSIVQDVVKQDAGWNWNLLSWSTYWSMILYALKTLLYQQTGKLLDESSDIPPPLFLQAPAELRPSCSFILSQIRPCINDFKKRDRYEEQGEVYEVVQKVTELVRILRSSLDVSSENSCDH